MYSRPAEAPAVGKKVSPGSYEYGYCDCVPAATRRKGEIDACGVK